MNVPRRLRWAKRSGKAMGLCCLAVVASFAGGARAETAPPADVRALGARRQLVLSLERLFGAEYLHDTVSMGGATVETVSATSVSAFTWPRSTAYAYPRAAADLFVGPNLSVGAAFGLAFGAQSIGEPGVPAMTQSITHLQIGPRVGYVVRLTPGLAVWPRAGVTFDYEAAEIPNVSGGHSSNLTNAVAGSVDVPVALTIIPRLLFTVAPTLNFTLWAQQHVSGPGPSNLYESRLVDVGLLGGFALLL